MKRNITVNLCGSLYHIDEDAYELLNKYLGDMRAIFRNSREARKLPMTSNRAWPSL